MDEYRKKLNRSLLYAESLEHKYRSGHARWHYYHRVLGKFFRSMGYKHFMMGNQLSVDIAGMTLWISEPTKEKYLRIVVFGQLKRPYTIEVRIDRPTDVVRKLIERGLIIRPKPPIT